MKVLTQIECPFVTMNTLLQRAVTGWVRFWPTSDSSFCGGLHFLDRTGSGSARECWFWQSLVAKRFQCQLLAVSHSLYMFYCGNGASLYSILLDPRCTMLNHIVPISIPFNPYWNCVSWCPTNILAAESEAALPSHVHVASSICFFERRLAMQVAHVKYTWDVISHSKVCSLHSDDAVDEIWNA